jgi:hypothetical protein
MTVTLMTLTHQAGTVWSALDERAALSSGFARYDSRVLRYWDAGIRLGPTHSHVAVLANAPSLEMSAGLVRQAGLQLEAFTPVIVTEVDARRAIITLDEMLPDELPTEFEAGSSIVSQAGLRCCGRCGGFGKHYRPPCP